MPNHFHAIIGIGKNENTTQRNTQRHPTDTTDTTEINNVQTHCNASPKNQFGPQSKNLASIIRGFKIGVTKNARQIHPNFTWQSRFYDHIIRNDQSYQKISEYIMNNPANWQDDKFNT